MLQFRCFFLLIFCLEKLSLNSYRGRLDIIADMLNVVKDKAKKTQIMFQANLSYKLLQRYLSEIMGASLIDFDGEARCYVLTDKGAKFLSAYQEYSKTNRDIEDWVNEAQERKRFLEQLCSEQV
jgi:predicted transcriptional regulator